MPHPLHPDPRVHEILDVWGMGHASPVARAARRLFRDEAELQAFFDLAIPECTQVAEAGYVHGRGPTGGMNFDCLSVLTTLDTVEARQDDLDCMAFLVWVDIVHTTHHTAAKRSGIPADEASMARAFLQRFRGTSAADLRMIFGARTWTNTPLAVWAKECLDRGVPASYMKVLLEDSALRYLGFWPPALVADCHQNGTPAEYIALFWDRTSVFDKLVGDGVPYEYAIALDESAGV